MVLPPAGQAIVRGAGVRAETKRSSLVRFRPMGAGAFRHPRGRAPGKLVSAISALAEPIVPRWRWFPRTGPHSANIICPARQRTDSAPAQERV